MVLKQEVIVYFVGLLKKTWVNGTIGNGYKRRKIEIKTEVKGRRVRENFEGRLETESGRVGLTSGVTVVTGRITF